MPGFRSLTPQHSPPLTLMRHAFPSQPGLLTIPIEKIHLPLTSRDQLPPLLAGLQWLWTHPTLKTEIFALLAAKICAGKKATGRPGMDLWQILVGGVVRLCLAADWDRLEHMPTTTPSCARGSACPSPLGASPARSSATRPCATTSPSSTTNCLASSSQAEGEPNGKWLIGNLCRPEVCSTSGSPVWP